MMEKHDLLAYYQFWVNGESLSRRYLFAKKPPTSPLAAYSAAPVAENGITRLTIGKYSNKSDVKLSINASRLESIYQIIIHGSQATNDTCDFSDVDIVVVIDDTRTFSAAQHHRAIYELKSLLRSMFLYDCLMHHGFMFMLRSGFACYEESFLPVDTLRNAVVLHGPPCITLKTSLPRALDQKQRLKSSVASLSRHLESGDFECNDYVLKSFLAGLLLIPCFLLQSINVFPYKRDSFSIGPQEFPSLKWSAIHHAEDLRLRWKRSPTRTMQNMVAKMMHPHAIIRLSRLYPPRTNVDTLLRNRSDAFKRSCKEFLDCLAAL